MKRCSISFLLACLLSCVQLFMTPWTIACQAPQSMRILQVRIWPWVSMPSSRGSSQPRDQIRSPALQVDSLPAELPGKPQLFSLLEKYKSKLQDVNSHQSEWPSSKNLQTINAGESVEEGNFLNCSWRCKLRPQRTIWRFLKKLRINYHMTQQSHYWVYSRESHNQNRHMYTNLHWTFTTARTWKQSRYPLASE